MGRTKIWWVNILGGQKMLGVKIVGGVKKPKKSTPPGAGGVLQFFSLTQILFLLLVKTPCKNLEPYYKMLTPKNVDPTKNLTLKNCSPPKMLCPKNFDSPNVLTPNKYLPPKDVEALKMNPQQKCYPPKMLTPKNGYLQKC